MATAAALPGSSMGKIQRWYNARRAAGKPVKPWELEAAYRGEMGSLAGQQSTNRGLTLQQERDAESRRMNDVNTGLTRERMAADREAQERAYALQAQQAGFQREQARLAEERAARMEERQKAIDAYEQKAQEDRTREETRRYEQNRIDQEADRNAQMRMQSTSSLTNVGLLGGISLLKGTDPIGYLKKNLFGTDVPTTLSDSNYAQTAAADDYSSVPGDFQLPDKGGWEFGALDNGQDTWDTYTDVGGGDGIDIGAGLSAPDYQSGWEFGALDGQDTWGTDFNYDWVNDPGWEFGAIDGFDTWGSDLDWGMVGSGLDWGSDWGSAVDWGSAYDVGSSFYF